MSWKKLRSRRVFDNPWMTVREDRVINPGGGQNDYGHVHFKNAAVAIVPVDAEGHTWIVGQDRYTLGEYSWEVPMGGSPPGQDLPLPDYYCRLYDQIVALSMVAAVLDEVALARRLSEKIPSLLEHDSVSCDRLRLPSVSMSSPALPSSSSSSLSAPDPLAARLCWIS